MSYLLLFITYCSFAFFTSELAKRKRRNPKFWGVMGFLFGIFALIFLAFLPKQTPMLREETTIVDEEEEITKIKATPDLWYYLDQKHTSHGPISFNRLQELVLSGQIQKSSYVWHESMQDWERLNQNTLLLQRLLDQTTAKS